MVELLSWIRFLGIKLPIVITKSWLFLITTLSSSLFILLPISLITYNNYYHSLIPKNSSYKIPLNFTQLNNGELWSNIISSKGDEFEIDRELSYVIEAEFFIVCKPKSELYAIDKIIYDFISVDTSPNSPILSDSKSKEIYLQENRVMHRGSFILNCDPYSIYSKNNYVVPYNLKFFIPPYFTTISQSASTVVNNYKLLGSKLNSLDDFQIRLKSTNGEDEFLIDDNYSFLNISVVWTGFRYYLVKYYYLFYLVGSLFFFGIMVGFGILVSYGMLYINNQSQNKNTYRPRRL